MPLSGELADPHAVVEIARATEQSGWDGLFFWDEVLTSGSVGTDLSDPWVVLAAAAMATSRIRLGPLVTPLPRRRVIKLARETVTLDRLSKGRLVLGLGIGVDDSRELSAFGEVVDARLRAKVLDEGTAVLVSLWAGERVNHRGMVLADDVQAFPGPVQQPRIPIWFGTYRTKGAPVERAARYDGIFPIFPNGVDPSGLARITETVTAARGTCDGFDIAVAVDPDDDLDKLGEAGVTWAMRSIQPGASRDQVLRLIEELKPA